MNLTRRKLIKKYLHLGFRLAIILIIVSSITSCGCRDDDPFFIFDTKIQFVDTSNQTLYGAGGIYQNEIPELIELDGLTTVSINFQTENERLNGIFRVPFDRNIALSPSGESYIIRYPDFVADTITVFYESYELGGSNCSQTNYRMIGANVNGQIIPVRFENEIVVPKSE